MKGDFVRLYLDEDMRRTKLPHQPWEGEWPPPERLGLIEGKSGFAHLMITDPQGEADAREHVAKQGHDFDEIFVVLWYRQASVSKINDVDAAAMTHVARGAAYVPEVADA